MIVTWSCYFWSVYSYYAVFDNSKQLCAGYQTSNRMVHSIHQRSTHEALVSTELRLILGQSPTASGFFANFRKLSPGDKLRYTEVLDRRLRQSLLCRLFLIPLQPVECYSILFSFHMVVFYHEWRDGKETKNFKYT